MSDYKEIKTTVIPEVETVRFYAETAQHVIDHHPEIGQAVNLPSIQEAVGKAIVSPTHVEKTYNNSFVFVDQESTNSAGDPLRVPVRVVGGDGTAARVKTFFFASTESPAHVVWRKGNG